MNVCGLSSKVAIKRTEAHTFTYQLCNYIFILNIKKKKKKVYFNVKQNKKNKKTTTRNVFPCFDFLKILQVVLTKSLPHYYKLECVDPFIA